MGKLRKQFPQSYLILWAQIFTTCKNLESRECQRSFAGIELWKEKKKKKLFMKLIMIKFHYELLPKETKLQISRKVQQLYRKTRIS